MNVLVTGGAGFIGSHVADRLLASGHQVSILDNLSTGRDANLLPDVPFYKMDIRDKDVHDLWEEKKFDAMMHLAAQMDVRKSVEDPSYDADVNLRGLLNLMEAGRKSGLKKIVFAFSGGAGYDDSVPFPTPETVPARPVSPYGIAKISSDLYLNYYHVQYGIPFVALRLGNVYGPRQNPFGEAGVIAIFSNRLLKGEPAKINGDGLQTRDYVFCKDIARAFALGLNYDKVDTFNIGTAIETDVVHLFNLIREAASSQQTPEHIEGKPGEVRRSCLDPKKPRIFWVGRQK